jgi:hypothetical protein
MYTLVSEILDTEEANEVLDRGKGEREERKRERKRGRGEEEERVWRGDIKYVLMRTCNKCIP